jgi:hypothetical protein
MQLEETLAELGGISLIHPFYNDEKRLELQIENWMTWPDEICKLVDVTLIDDHSKNPLKIEKKKWKQLRNKGLQVRIFRIEDDLKWNTPGALNLGFTVAPKRWILTMDSDCFFDAENIKKLMDFRPRTDRIHKFKRKRFGTTEPANWLNNERFLPCTMLMQAEVYWRVGGFDEDFTGAYSGGYGFFDTYFDRCAKELGYLRAVVEGIIAGEWLPSVSGDPVFPDLIKNPSSVRGTFHINKVLMHEKVNSVDFKNRESKILRFRWRQIK